MKKIHLLIILSSLACLTNGQVPGKPQIKGPDTVSIGCIIKYYIVLQPNSTNTVWNADPNINVYNTSSYDTVFLEFMQLGKHWVSAYSVNSYGNGPIDTLWITVLQRNTAHTPVGDSLVCQGKTGYIYTVDEIPGATYYKWTNPVGTTITSGNGTRMITLDISETALGYRDLIVYDSNKYCNGLPGTLKIKINQNSDVKIDIKQTSPDSSSPLAGTGCIAGAARSSTSASCGADRSS